MAVAFDAVTVAGAVNSWTHTCTGTDRILFVTTKYACTGVTYAGVALALVHSLTMTGGTSGGATPLQLWVGFAPASGANTVACGYTGTYGGGVSASYTGAQQSGPLDGSTPNTSSTSATSLTTSLTTVANNCWIIVAEFGYAFGVAPVAGAGLTLRGASSALGSPGLFDSNGPNTPAGSFSGTTTIPFSAGEAIFHIMAAFAPATAAAAERVEPFLWGPL